MLHVMWNDITYDLTFDELDIGDLSTEEDVRVAVARYLSAPIGKFTNFRLDTTGSTWQFVPHMPFGN